MGGWLATFFHIWCLFHTDSGKTPLFRSFLALIRLGMLPLVLMTAPESVTLVPASEQAFPSEVITPRQTQFKARQARSKRKFIIIAQR